MVPNQKDLIWIKTWVGGWCTGGVGRWPERGLMGWFQRRLSSLCARRTAPGGLKWRPPGLHTLCSGPRTLQRAGLAGMPAATLPPVALALLLSFGLAGCGALPVPGGEPPVQPVAPVAPTTVEPVTRPPRLGLALGGGAARGFAHVGVIQVLEANGVRPDLVAGTSAGSLVAALYASGMTGSELEQAALTMDENTLADWRFPLLNRGLLQGEALARYVRRAVGGRLLEQLALPLGILATDLGSGRGVLFRRGDTAQAVRASSAVPGVFEPVGIGGREYVDGGLVAPVPVRQAREMGAELVLAVDVSADPASMPADGLLNLLLRTTAIMGQSIARHDITTAEVVVRPALAGVGSADFSARQRSIEAGRQAMQAALPQLKAAMQRMRVVVAR